ncbi:hypothetical protein [Cohnella terricola]|uniref:Uncharacterized protein n=1 Tax=Cohnella terricola TaxID=1289167 RepID=A0A559JBC1_9BACL|nr:hypothetical protein [Cohnella terricola]TVX97147.1 hypothetical protein FPZ45_19570 [Cohnella terricola]
MFRVKAVLTLAGFVVGIAGGIGIMLNDDASDSIRNAIGASGTSNAMGVTSMGVSSIDLSGMDLETALLMVQNQRANLLDKQLQDQINQVQSRNQEVSNYATLKGRLQQLQPVSGASAVLPADLRNDLTKAGIKVPEAQTLKSAEWTNLIAQLNERIDSLSNSQQMDMLRLQSLSNKRNEAFDVMTNFVKKMQESRSSIIGNMR